MDWQGSATTCDGHQIIDQLRIIVRLAAQSLKSLSQRNGHRVGQTFASKLSHFSSKLVRVRVLDTQCHRTAFLEYCLYI